MQCAVLYWCRIFCCEVHMQRTIYIDILFCVNFIIDYIILLTVRRFMNISVRRLRLLLGAAAGGLSSFVILLPALPSGLSLILSLAFACTIVGIAFAPLPRALYIRTAAAFFLISFGYCGAMMALLVLFAPSSLIVRNSSVYINISPLVLIVATVICYVVLHVIIRITGRGESSGTKCKIEISVNGRKLSCTALIDSGSTLCEPFSGDPVIVLSPGLLCEEDFSHGTRLVPYSGVGSSGLLKAVRPDTISVITEEGERKIDGFVANGIQKLAAGIDAILPASAVQ